LSSFYANLIYFLFSVVYENIAGLEMFIFHHFSMPVLFYQHLFQANITSKMQKYTISYLSTRWNAA